MTNTTQQSAIQNNTYISAIDTGTVNTYKIALTPAMQTSLEFAEVIFRVLNTNTGASTIQINTGTIYALYGLNGTALQGGELVAGGECKAIFNGTNYYIEYCTTGALQIVSGSQTNQATNVGAIQQNKYIYASSDTGTANTYKPVISPAPTIITGSEIIFTPANANTGASTLQINAIGTVYNLFGMGGIALQGGEIIATGECKAVYDGTRFVLEYSAGGASQIGTPSKSQHATTVVSIQQNATIYGVDTGTANTYKPTISPAPTITAGSEIMWSAANANTGSSTIQINGTGTVYNLYGFAGISLQGGEIVASGKCKAVYNGTQFILEYCTGGALQIVDAINSQQASSLNQVTSLISISVPPLLLMAQGII
jgi:hypothetical protein